MKLDRYQVPDIVTPALWYTKLHAGHNTCDAAHDLHMLAVVIKRPVVRG